MLLECISSHVRGAINIDWMSSCQHGKMSKAEISADNTTAELHVVAVANLLWQSWQGGSAFFIRRSAGGAFLLIALHHLHNDHCRDANTAMRMYACHMMHAWQKTADCSCGARFCELYD